MSLFKRIRILDVTFFQLPDVFSSEYPGSGGRGNTAGVKIQLEYDVLRGQFLHVQVGPGNRNDKTYGTTCLKTVESGDLCLPDLGYFDLKEARVILHRLTEKQTQTRLHNQTICEKKKGFIMKEKSKKLMGMNVYITNMPSRIMPIESIHVLYSLRWQIEILFKTWKSLFKIHHCKEMKKERLECHLYGQLIRILLCSSTMFQMR